MKADEKDTVFYDAIKSKLPGKGRTDVIEKVREYIINHNVPEIY